MGLLCDFIVLSLLFVSAQSECTRFIVRNMSIIKQLWHFTRYTFSLHCYTSFKGSISIDESLIVLGVRSGLRTSQGVGVAVRRSASSDSYISSYCCTRACPHVAMLRERETWATPEHLQQCCECWQFVVCNDNSEKLRVK